MDEKESIDEMKKWYFNPEVKFEIIRYLKNREFATLVPKAFGSMDERSTRYYRVHNVQSLDYCLWRRNKTIERNTPYNCYMSLNRYVNGLPITPQDNEERKKVKDNWLQNHHKEIEASDMLIDIDAPNHAFINESFEDAKKVKELLDKFNVPYYLNFSGCGFHFIIPYLFFKTTKHHFKPFDEGNIWDLYADIDKKLYDTISEMIDYGRNQSRKLCKVPYSLSLYKDNAYCCFPFVSEEEFNNFKLEMAKPVFWLGRIRGRGNHLFHSKGNNPNKFLESLGVNKKWYQEE